jgi:cytochrome c-type biogenesis protein
VRKEANFGVLLLALIAGCVPESGADADDRPMAPEVAVLSLAGDTVSLAGQRGKVVLLNIWATWCPPCREEMPLLQRIHEENAPAGLMVVGVSVDAWGEEDRIREFLDAHGITFPIWLDPGEQSSLGFRSVGVPATYLIDREGAIVWRKLGPLTEGDAAFAAGLEAALAED